MKAGECIMLLTMPPEDAVMSALQRLGVAHEIIPIDPAFADTAAFCERYGYTLDRSANTIIVASRKPSVRYAACVVLASTRLDVNGETAVFPKLDAVVIGGLAFDPAARREDRAPGR